MWDSFSSDGDFGRSRFIVYNVLTSLINTWIKHQVFHLLSYLGHLKFSYQVFHQFSYLGHLKFSLRSFYAQLNVLCLNLRFLFKVKSRLSQTEEGGQFHKRWLKSAYIHLGRYYFLDNEVHPRLRITWTKVHWVQFLNQSKLVRLGLVDIPRCNIGKELMKMPSFLSCA